MKISAFLLFCCMVNLLAAPTYSQSTRISLNLKDATIEEVLNQIEDKSEFYFLYNQKLIDATREVSIEADKEPIVDILNKILNSDIKFIVYDRQIILTPDSLTPFSLSQQELKITGTVTDKQSGEPLVGVNVVVTGTNRGVITDLTGNYSIEVPQGGRSLTFSFVGMEPQEITIGTLTHIDVMLTESAIGLEEVVVIGYGTQKRSDLTGSMGNITAKEIENLPTANLFSAVQGKISGLVINTTNFAPGSDPEIIIRGYNSLSSSNTPLIILDGIPFDGGITQINPNDIQSFDVLKDASSTAIYGSRGSNGVILITTKSGKKGKPVIQYNGTMGVSSMAKKIGVLDREGYIKLRQDVAKINGATDLDPAGLLNTDELEAYNNGTSVDWQDLASRDAIQQDHQLSISGANENVNYYISVGHVDKDGILKGSQYKRNTVRINGSYHVTDWLEFGTNSQLSFEDYGHTQTVNIANVVIMSPLGKVYNDDGSYNMYPIYPDVFYANPMDNLNAKTDNYRNRSMANVYALVNIPFIKGLSYRLNYGNTFEHLEYSNYWPSTSFVGRPSSGSADRNNQVLKDLTMENILKYNRSFGKHRVDVTGLYSRQSNKDDYTNVHGESFINDNLSFYGIGNGKVLKTATNYTAWSMESFMGRINYIYNDRYFLTMTVRTDGFSGFGENNKYGAFPSVALAWTISNEDFLKNITAIEFLKLRASYGLNGNQAIPSYRTLSGMTGGTDYYINNTTAVGFYPGTLGNSSLCWESTRTLNFGADFSLYKGRIGGNIDVYFKKADGLLLERQLPTAIGFSSIWDNVASTTNRGIEININPLIIDKHDFKWSANINFSLNRNKIVQLFEDNQDDKTNRWFIGYPVKSNYNYVIDGVWQTTDDIAHSIMPAAKPGDFKLKDVNNDGKIDDTDRTIQGSQLPDYIMGINNVFTYKNFSLSFFIYTVQGGQRDNPLLNFNNWMPYRTNCLDVPYWSLDNPSTKYSSPYYTDPYALDIYEDLSFIRLKNLTFSYNFNKTLIDRLHLGSLKVYITGENLLCITKWSGYDPENTQGWMDGYPSARTISLGINVSF